MTIFSKDGKADEAQCLYSKGEPEHLHTQKKEIEEKFCGFAIYSGLTQKECDEVIEELGKE